ncbi:MAG: dienelactone hydrolase family protein [Phenylobacterium sp.]|uniref:dienelactone hydrolase family protein n=1 Tax=Phenylobacterium sp. TaxID=1871053 RepID=UPI002732D64A|nr:dienelactone hydrolase family protein [Phenylobacterium sp.]MDP1643718.1 dienelactone hydrolase family protein [Phenylobacterium sp.]MDP3117334.1 dienelactone hydrolase family protein [Phenylobacterium sp.]MDP3383041.1 dienelactone hydrolase family protein [Phenylobacterium sp.]
MGDTITLKSAADGYELSAYHEAPFTSRKGGVIVLQEIFGIDKYVRADVERWAKAGYEALAPSLFDRRERGFTAGHDADGMAAGIAHARATPMEQALADIAAARDFLAPRGKVCVVGYCYGGSLAWLSAAKVEGIAAASSYYGSMVKANADLPLACPVIVHLGHTDPGIKADEVEAAVKAAHPEVPVYIYEGAGHGFNNESPERYHEEAADLARLRTRELFESA